ncbi:MAG: DNA polymerase II large subunit [Candidatus Nanoarchaeia archaeon]
MNQYFKEIENKVNEVYEIAKQARAKGLDPVSIVEISLAKTAAQRVLGLVSTIYPQIADERIEKRIKELEKEYGFLDPAVCLKIAEEIAKEKFCKFKTMEEAIDAGARVAFGYLTLGVVAAPLEGYTHFKIKKTKDNKDYLAAYFSGPIGGAGRTAASIFLLIFDYLRETFGFAKYDATDIEIKRTITEIYDRHERISNLQYLPSEKEIEMLVRNLPIQIDGDPTEEREVSNYKDLERIETNRIRSGMCLILGEGIAQKAPKLLKALNKVKKNGFKISDWDWLEKFVEFQKTRAEEKKKVATGTYIQDLVAGRPVLGHPSRSGAFRLRYGRCRNSGYSAVAINPLSMKILNEFIGIGTQLKLEKPTKGAAIVSCDSIDGPIVKLEDDSVLRLDKRNADKVSELKERIKEIIYSGDILISYGDFYNRNHVLLPCGYVEEWWLTELKEIATKYSNPEMLKDKSQAELEDIQNALQYLDKQEPSLEDAMKISELFKIPLYPKYIFYWSQISLEQFLSLMKWFCEATIRNGKIDLPYESHRRQELAVAKRALELLGVEHRVTTANVVIDKEESRALALNLGLNLDLSDFNKVNEIYETVQKEKQEQQLQTTAMNVLDIVNKFSKVKIKDKAGTFIGSRMGRPEKAKPRELKGSPHVLFPVGEEGGKLRSVQAALEQGFVKADYPLYFCENCRRETIYFICESCGNKTKQLYFCSSCSRKIASESCPLHGKAKIFAEQKIDIKHYFESALKYLEQEEIPRLIKGVRGTSSVKHIPENLAKGILRAKHNLHVNKDGTIRYDATEVPLTQFRAKEIGVSIEKLKELGYNKDIDGKELKNEEQLLELKPHDVILPCSPDSLDEKADEVFIRVADFIDDLLVKFYKLEPFYNVKKREDLVGHLLLCIAPHNCAGVVGRIIGFSKTQCFFASPYMHAAMRRDCDGDEGAMMLLLDALLNFSREFLPAHRGATQDAPLILNTRIRANESDDMVFDVDLVKNYPLELYMAAEKSMFPNTVKIEQIRNRLETENEFKNLYFTHDVSDINEGVHCSSYKTLVTMQDKVLQQMDLARKLRAVDEGDVAKLVIERHFMRDIKGNFNKFTQQQFRCVNCNEKYRRPPLVGKCTAILSNGKRCDGRIIFTIAEGSIVKYLEPAIELAKNYNVSPYVRQSLELSKMAIETLFGKETEKQQDLKKWF